MSIFNSKRSILWSHSSTVAYELDNDVHDWLYIPSRVMPLVRPNKDMIVLPKSCDVLNSFVRFCIKILGIKSNQIIWTPGNQYLLDKEIKDNISKICIELISSKKKWIVMPYSVTAEFIDWYNILSLVYGDNVQKFGDSEEFVKTFGHKGILHPSKLHKDARGLLKSNARKVKTAVGFQCFSNKSKLDEVGFYFILNGIHRFLIKPVFGAAGEGIIFIKSFNELKEYDFPMGDVILEQELEIDRDTNGKQISCSVQFNGKSIYGDVLDQLFEESSWEGNVSPSSQSKKFIHAVRRDAKSVLQWLSANGLKGPGGFDFVSVKGIPYLIDVNIGRFTGAHPAKIFHQMYSPNSVFESRKVEPSLTSVWNFWKNMNRKGIAFNPLSDNKFGVFPLCYLPGMWCMLIAFGKNKEHLAKLHQEALDCM